MATPPIAMARNVKRTPTIKTEILLTAGGVAGTKLAGTASMAGGDQHGRWGTANEVSGKTPLNVREMPPHAPPLLPGAAPTRSGDAFSPSAVFNALKSRPDGSELRPSTQIPQAVAQLNEADLVQGMRNLGAHWQAVAGSSDILIAACKGNTFIAKRLKPGAMVLGVDLQRTNSLMSPYLGIVRIRGVFQNSDFNLDGTCPNTLSGAKRNTNWRGNNMDYDFVIHYQVNGSELVLSGSNNLFQNNFYGQHGHQFQLEPNSPWNAIFRFPIQP